jgi:hypothetical protein
MLEREMAAAGDRLRLAIAVENDFNRVNPGADLPDLRSQWFECRRIVDQLAEDYVAAVQEWRKALMDGVEPQAAPQKAAATLFRRLLARTAPKSQVPGLGRITDARS